MPKQKAIRKISVIFLIVLAILSLMGVVFLNANPVKAIEIPEEERWQDYDNYIVIDEDTTWSGHVIYNDPYKSVVIANGATLTIKKGTQVEILNLEVNLGRIVAEGTAEEKIIFTKAVPVFSDGYKSECSRGEAGMIKFSETGWLNGYGVEPSIMRYVEFDSMGSYTYIDQEECACPYVDGNCQSMRWNIFPGIFETAQAAEWPDVANPALKFEYGRLHIENSGFKNNHYADIEVKTDFYFSDERISSLEVINSNFEGNSEDTALISSVLKYIEDGDPVADNNLVKLKNNWYGHIGGPKVAPNYLVGGEMVKGDYTLDGFRSKSLIADPVIMIPGIMGSAQVKEVWKIDPITHSFDDLISSLQKTGYIKNINLFEFPYEWRKNNTETANVLRERIQEIINETKVSKVDVVAHSMGGLVARQYVESNYYQNNIDKLITLGTPHKGAPKAYLYWEAAEFGLKMSDSIMKHHFKNEAKHAGYEDLQKYIQAKVPSVRELLPDYSYLKDNSTGEMINYGDDYPRNTFLEDLNKSENVANLDKVQLINIIGDLNNNQSTISRIRIVESTEAGKWEHGMPENFYAENGDNGLEMGEGDETVPKISSESISSNSEVLNSSHSNLPTKAQCKIIEKLTNNGSCYYTNEIDIPNILLINIFSPVDIQVIAPDGKKVGKDFATGEIINEIDGAYYSGAGAENEFLTIPNPIDGEYKILTQGTGDGEYKIEAAKITEDQETGVASESVAIIQGSAISGQEEEKEIKVAGTEVTAGNQDATPPTITGTATTQPNIKGWYNSDVIIHFVAADNESGVDFVTPDVVIATEGKNQSVTGIAKDKAGNEASVTVAGINIDKTAPNIEISSPEAETYLNNQIVAVDYSVADNLSSATSKMFYDEKDFPGDKIDLAFQNLGEHKLKITALDEAGNYAEKEIVFRAETSLKAVSDNINRYATLKLIRDKADKTVLLARLKLLEEIAELIKTIENCRFFKGKAKEKLIAAFERQSNQHLEWMINYIEKKSLPKVKNGIDPKAGDLLIESLNFLKYD